MGVKGSEGGKWELGGENEEREKYYFFQTFYFAIILDLQKGYKEVIENFHIPFTHPLLIWAFYVLELVPNYFSNKLPLSGLNQHKFIKFEFWRSEA